jgi:hypothetical protein
MQTMTVSKELCRDYIQAKLNEQHAKERRISMEQEITAIT